MLKIGIDIGYGYTKAAASNGKEVIFPSLIGEGFKRQYEGIFANNYNGIELDNIHIEIDGKDYFVGELASLESKSCSLAFDQNKISHVSTDTLLAAAVLLLMDKGDEDISLVAGLPFSYYVNQKQQFNQYLSNYNKKATLYAGKNKITRQIKFSLTETFPQSAGAVFQIFQDHSIGKHGMIGCIDIGTKTTDISVFAADKMKIVKYLSGTIESGAHVIYSYIAREINSILSGVELGPFKLEQILRNGAATIIRGREIDLSEAIQEGKTDLSRKIKDEIALRWGQNLDHFSRVFLAGGGAQLLKDTIQDIYHGAIVPEGSEMLNAKGFRIVANRLAKRFASV